MSALPQGIAVDLIHPKGYTESRDRHRFPSLGRDLRPGAIRAASDEIEPPCVVSHEQHGAQRRYLPVVIEFRATVVRVRARARDLGE